MRARCLGQPPPLRWSGERSPGSRESYWSRRRLEGEEGAGEENGATVLTGPPEREAAARAKPGDASQRQNDGARERPAATGGRARMSVSAELGRLWLGECAASIARLRGNAAARATRGRQLPHLLLEAEAWAREAARAPGAARCGESRRASAPAVPRAAAALGARRRCQPPLPQLLDLREGEK